MAKSNKTLRVDFNAFDGIDLTRCHSGKESLADIVNFHISDGGSLCKRSGYTHICDFSHLDLGDIHAVWSGKLKGSFRCFLAVGHTIFEYDIGSGETKEIGTLNAESPSLSFFTYKDELYIKNSNAFYLVGNSSLCIVKGYVPLLGKDWPTTYPGEIYQPLNLVNRQARISYAVGEQHTSMLPTKYPVKSILSMWRNGNLLSPNEYYFDSAFNTINLPDGVNVGDKYYAVLEYEDFDEDEYAILKQCTKAQAFGTINDFRIFTWGAKDKSSCMFVSGYVSKDDKAEADKYFPDHDDIYFKRDCSFIVGDGNKTVTAVSRHYDRVLIFTDRDVWMASTAFSGGEDLPLMNINSTAGCSSSGGAVMAGNDPVTVSKSTILRWTSDTDEVNDCNAYSISNAINGKLSQSFFDNAIAYKHAYKNELWFADPTGEGFVWIYSIGKNSWVRFSGIHGIRGFFDADGKVGFFTREGLFVFDEALSCDVDRYGNTTDIEASLQSGLLDFGSKEYKRLIKTEIIGDLQGKELSLCLICDNGESIPLKLVDRKEHSISISRLTSGRFKFLKLFISAKGDVGQTLHGISLCAKEKITK